MVTPWGGDTRSVASLQERRGRTGCARGTLQYSPARPAPSNLTLLRQQVAKYRISAGSGNLGRGTPENIYVKFPCYPCQHFGL